MPAMIPITGNNIFLRNKVQRRQHQRDLQQPFAEIVAERALLHRVALYFLAARFILYLFRFGLIPILLAPVAFQRAIRRLVFAPQKPDQILA